MSRAGEHQTEATRSHRWSDRRDRLVFMGLAAVGGAGSVGFNRLVADRLSSRTSSDVRAAVAGLSAVGFLALGLQLALVSWSGSLGHRTRISTGSVWLVAAPVVAGLLGGVATGIFVDAGAEYRLATGSLIAVSVTAMLIAVVPRAELLDAERWIRLGALLVAEPAVRFTVGAVVVSDGADAVNFVPIAAAQVGTACGAFLLRPRSVTSPERPPARVLFRGVMASAGLLFTFVASSVALRSNLADDASRFNEAAVTWRALVFLPLVFSVLRFPAMARHPSGSVELRRAYVSALVWTVATTAVAAGATLLAPTRVAGLLVAGDIEAAPSTIRLLAISAACLGIATVSLLLHVAHGSRLSLAAWGSAVLMVLGQVWARSADQLAVASALAAGALLVAVSVPAILRVQPILHSDLGRHRVHPAPPSTEVSIVVPSYNPGPQVVDTVQGLREYFRSTGVKASIVVVSDGSTDGSIELLDASPCADVTHLKHPVNRGKGAALRTGFAACTGSVVGFIDADGDIPPSAIGEMLEIQNDTKADIVFASKLHPDSVVEMSTLRRLTSFAYRSMIRLLFQLDVRDTQTGAKLYRREVISSVLPLLREEQFALDLELFVAARAAGFDHFVEAPVELRRSTDAATTITLRSVRRMFADTLRLFWRAKLALHYIRSTYVATTSAEASSMVAS